MNTMTHDYLEKFATAVGNMGISAYEAAQAIHKVSQALANSNRNMCNITTLQTEINNLKYQTQQDKMNTALITDLRDQVDNIQNELDSRTAALDWEVSDIRSALDAQTEKSKQKSDLEIFSAIEWDEEFLKIMNEPIIVDF